MLTAAGLAGHASLDEFVNALLLVLGGLMMKAAAWVRVLATLAAALCMAAIPDAVLPLVFTWLPAIGRYAKAQLDLTEGTARETGCQDSGGARHPVRFGQVQQQAGGRFAWNRSMASNVRCCSASPDLKVWVTLAKQVPDRGVPRGWFASRSP